MRKEITRENCIVYAYACIMFDVEYASTCTARFQKLSATVAVILKYFFKFHENSRASNIKAHRDSLDWHRTRIESPRDSSKCRARRSIAQTIGIGDNMNRDT